MRLGEATKNGDRRTRRRCTATASVAPAVTAHGWMGDGVKHNLFRLILESTAVSKKSVARPRHVVFSSEASNHNIYIYIFFFPSSSPFFSISLLVVTQIQGHIAGSSPPSPLRLVPCNFIARRYQLFLPSSTCVEYCAYPH